MRTRATEPDPARLEVYTWPRHGIPKSREIPERREIRPWQIPTRKNGMRASRAVLAHFVTQHPVNVRHLRLVPISVNSQECKKKKNTYWSCRRDTQTHTLSRHFLLKKEIIKTVRVISWKILKILELFKFLPQRDDNGKDYDQRLK